MNSTPTIAVTAHDDDREQQPDESHKSHFWDRSQKKRRRRKRRVYHIITNNPRFNEARLAYANEMVKLGKPEVVFLGTIAATIGAIVFVHVNKESDRKVRSS